VEKYCTTSLAVGMGENANHFSVEKFWHMHWFHTGWFYSTDLKSQTFIMLLWNNFMVNI